MIAQDQIASLQGATVFDRDGDKIGSLGQVYLDTSTNQPSWASVNTGLFGLKESLVPISDADATADGIRVPYAKQTVKDAPNVDVSHDEPLMPDDVSRLYEHYNLGGGGFASTSYDESGTSRTGYDAGAAQAGTVSDAEFRGSRDRDLTDRDITDRSDTDRSDTDRSDTDRVGFGDAMTSPQERPTADTGREQADRPRLRRYVVTEDVRTGTTVSREELPPPGAETSTDRDTMTGAVRGEQIDTDVPGRDNDRLR